MQFPALGLEIPEDHPDRNRYFSMAVRQKQIRSSDVTEITLMSPGDIVFLYSDGVYDGSDAGDTVAAPPNGAPAQEWDVRSLGRGLFQFVNRASGRAASLRGQELGFQITPTL